MPAPIGRMSIRVAQGESPDSWRAALGGDWLASSTRLKEEGGDWVRRATLRVGEQARDVVIKRRASRGVFDSLKILIGASRFARHWRNAQWLLDRGCQTGRPLAHLRSRSEEILVLEFLPGRTVLDYLAKGGLTSRQQHAIAAAVGVQVAQLVRAGRFNRDHKPSNLLVTEAGPGHVQVAILDCVGLRRGEDFARMLASLVIEPTGVNCPPRLALMARVVRAFHDEMSIGHGPPTPRNAGRRQSALSLPWLLARAIVNRHGDPTPRTNPLA